MHIAFFFNCRAGKSVFSHHSIWLSKEPPENDYKSVCPNLLFCKENCEFKNEFLLKYLDGKTLIDEKDLSSFRIMLGDSSATKVCLVKWFSENPSSDLSERFERLFIIRDRAFPAFIDRRMTWLSTYSDIEAIKKLYLAYPNIIVRIDAIPFDKSDNQRKAFISYFQWLISFYNQTIFESTIGQSFFNSFIFDMMITHSMTIEFARILLEFINQNPKTFKREEFNINQLKQYLITHSNEKNSS